jgi:MoxR-like ATPase
MEQTDIDMQRVEAVREGRDRILGEIRKVIIGQQDLVDKVLVALFAGGHTLLVGVPGLAKTLLVSTLSKAMSLSFKRIQFTPDMMPSDIIGTEVLEEDHVTGKKQFVFVQGPVFTNLLLADEINRTPPKTQAALMESMQEKQVSVGRKTYRLEEPFMVMATQNPIEQEGTYPLPEAQLDRFMFLVWVNYPTGEELEAIVKSTTGGKHQEPQPVITAKDLVTWRQTVRMIPVSDHVLNYISRLVLATHPTRDDAPEVTKKYLSWGAGPRAGQYLALGAKSSALLRGNLQATVEDVRYIAREVLRHRIVINFAAQADDITADKIIDRLLEWVPENPKLGKKPVA